MNEKTVITTAIKKKNNVSLSSCSPLAGLHVKNATYGDASETL